MAISIASILNQWEAVGIFDYLLPFLLIFAVVFGILSATNIIGKQKGVHVVVAFVIGLLALRLGFVQQFFLEVFPRMGVGIAVILTLLILTGLFINESEAKFWMYGIAAVAVVVWLIVTVGSFENVGWFGSYGYLEDYAGVILGAVLLIGLMIVVVISKSDKPAADGKFKTQSNS